jgi:anti-sigma factor RsiW
MNCLDFDRLLYPFLDGELLPEERLDFEQHLATCAACSTSTERERNALAIIKNAVRVASPKAPESLKRKLLAGIHGEQKRQRKARFLRLSAAAAGVAICAVAANHQWRSFQQRRFINDVTSRYARQYPLEISRRSPGELASWFETKLNHRVAVPNFPNATAAGARLLNVREKQAALIRYDTQRPGEERSHPMGLFVYQDEADDVAPLPNVEFGSGNGFNVVSWRDGDVVYRLVSDLDEQDVRQLLAEPGSPSNREANDGRAAAAEPSHLIGQMPNLDVKPAALQR